jgi:glycosyltransferase involved in cell wall biosynthesis
MIIACSQLVYEEVNRVYAGSLKIIKSTIDTDYLNNIIYENKLYSNSFDEGVTFVCSGSISDRKGTDLFIQIANYFRNSNYKFLWLGKFSKTGYSEWITDWVINLQLPNIKFVSPSSQVEYYSLMKNSNIYLSTSREESLGLSIMEALYLNKPVIALNSGGSKLMIDQTNGIVIDSFEIDNIASQINIFLKSKLQKIDFSNSNKFFEDYNLENEFSLWQDLLILLTL